MRTIQLDDKPHKIRFNFNALAEYELMTGKSALAFDNIGFADVRALAYVGLKEGDKNFKMTLEEVGAKLAMESMTEVTTALTEDLSSGKK
jgi:hypothetical protein